MDESRATIAEALRVTSAELERMKIQHPKTEHDYPNCKEYTCIGDHQRSDGLCDQRRLVNRIEVLESGLRAILEEHHQSDRAPSGRRLCGHVEEWPCPAAQYARAALEGKM